MSGNIISTFDLKKTKAIVFSSMKTIRENAVFHVQLPGHSSDCNFPNHESILYYTEYNY